MKKQRKNPLEPFPDFEGAPAWGGTQGGVHTAASFIQALPYAVQKGDPERDDYPVILGLYVSDQDPETDLDSYRAAKNLANLLRDPQLSVSDFFDWMESYLPDEVPYAQRGDMTLNYLFSHSDPSIDYNTLRLFHDFLEDTPPEDQKDLLLRAAEGKLSETEKRHIFGQQKYMQPVGPESIFAVYFVKPFWPTVMGFDVEDDGDYVSLGGFGADVVPAEVFEKRSAPYNVVYEPGDGHVAETPEEFFELVLVWGEDTTGADDIEYHGTSWKNFARALPEIAEQIEPPPSVPLPEDLAREMYRSYHRDRDIARVVEWTLSTDPSKGKREVQRQVERWYETADADDIDSMMYTIDTWYNRQAQKEYDEEREAEAAKWRPYWSDLVRIFEGEGEMSPIKAEEGVQKLFDVARKTGNWKTVSDILKHNGVIDD